MAKFKALEAFEFEGKNVEAGTELELTEEQATALAGKVEAVAASAESAPGQAG